MQEYYEINAPMVISEPMDEDLVVINLDNGCYYSFNKTAAQLWNQLEQGFAINQAASQMALLCESEEAQVLADFLSFVDRMLEEQLIRACEGHSKDWPPLKNGQGGPYLKPSFEKYSDMQEMLLLDPIHEVSEAGWPNQKKK
jgi:hypothetical protein